MLPLTVRLRLPNASTEKNTNSQSQESTEVIGASPSYYTSPSVHYKLLIEGDCLLRWENSQFLTEESLAIEIGSEC